MATRIDLFGNTLSPNTVTGGSRLTFSAPNSGSTSKNKTKSSKKDSYKTYSNLGNYASLSYTTGGSSGGGYTPVKADISGLLAAYEKQAEANKNTAKLTYDTTRNDLLTSLKRFQEQNAKDVDSQRRSYLSEQASLESAREQADRNSRISASARGLGGSGLQQLAQLQNLLNQGQDISELAGENQSIMDKLASALQQKQEDTDTNIANALKTYNDTINNIDSTLANQKAQAIYENEQAYAQALNSARAQAAASRASSTTTNYGNVLQSLLDSSNVDLRKLANSSKTNTIREYASKAGLDLSGYKDSYIQKNKSDIKESIARAIANNTNSYVQNALQSYNLSNSAYSGLKNDINSMLKYYGFDKYY